MVGVTVTVTVVQVVAGVVHLSIVVVVACVLFNIRVTISGVFSDCGRSSKFKLLRLESDHKFESFRTLSFGMLKSNMNTLPFSMRFIQ